MCTKEGSSYTDSGNKIMKDKRRHSNFSEMFDFHFAKVTLRLKKRSWSVLYGLTTKPPTCDVPLFFFGGGDIKTVTGTMDSSCIYIERTQYLVGIGNF